MSFFCNVYFICLVFGILWIEPSTAFLSNPGICIFPRPSSKQQLLAGRKLKEFSSELDDLFNDFDDQKFALFHEAKTDSEFLQHLSSLKLLDTTNHLAQLSEIVDTNEEDERDEKDCAGHINIQDMRYVEFEKPFWLFPLNRYVIRNFYPQLLREIFSAPKERVVLMGAPGLGTSRFIFFLLLYFLNAEVKNLVGDVEKLRNVKYIIYHYSSESFRVFNVETKKAFWSTSFSQFFEVMNRSNIMYVFEPGTTKTHTPVRLEGVPSVCLVSPHLPRIEEYQKDASIRYMPMWILDEARLANKVLDKVSDDALKQRFEQVGGVIRPLLHDDESYRKYLERQLSCIQKYDALDAFDHRDPLTITQGHDENVGHFVAHYTVSACNFSELKPRISTALVGQLLTDLKIESNYDKCTSIIRKWKAGERHMENVEKLFERVACEAIVGGKRMTTHCYGPLHNNEESKARDDMVISLLDAEIIESHVQERVPGKMFYPKTQNFPVVEFYALVNWLLKMAFLGQCKTGDDAKGMNLRPWWTLTHEKIPNFELFHYVLFAIDADMAKKWNTTVGKLWDADFIKNEASQLIKAAGETKLVSLCEEFDIPVSVIDGNPTNSRNLLASLIAKKYEALLSKLTYSIKTIDDCDIDGYK